MEEEIIIPETRPQPKVALLTFGEYYALNCVLSEAKGYDFSKLTQRVLPMNPRAAKTEIVYNEENEVVSYVPKLVAPISSQIQIDYPELLEGVELVKSYIPTGEEIYEFIVDMIDMNVVNWTAMQFSAVKGIGKELTLYVSQQLYDGLTEGMKDGLTQLGLNLQMRS